MTEHAGGASARRSTCRPSRCARRRTSTPAPTSGRSASSSTSRVAGAPPFDGETMTALSAAILQDRRAPSGCTRPDVPPQLEAVVRRAGEGPQPRFQTSRSSPHAGALRVALSRPRRSASRACWVPRARRGSCSSANLAALGARRRRPRRRRHPRRHGRAGGVGRAAARRSIAGSSSPRWRSRASRAVALLRRSPRVAERRRGRPRSRLLAAERRAADRRRRPPRRLAGRARRPTLRRMARRRAPSEPAAPASAAARRPPEATAARPPASIRSRRPREAASARAAARSRPRGRPDPRPPAPSRPSRRTCSMIAKADQRAAVDSRARHAAFAADGAARGVGPCLSAARADATPQDQAVSARASTTRGAR